MMPEEIRALRTSLGLSQEQFAQRIGTTLNTIYRWEAGKAHPRGLYAKALADLERKSRKAAPPTTGAREEP